MIRPLRAGLTLLELMVVLVILAIVATVAVRSLEPQVTTQRLQSSSRLLEEIRFAALGPVGKYQLDRTPLTSGFVADMGRLPRLEQAAEPAAPGSEDNRVPARLEELWDSQSPLAVNYPFQFRAGPNQPRDYSHVRIPCGWRGPYLQLAAGSRSLVDPWGRPPTVRVAANGEISEVAIELPESLRPEPVAPSATGVPGDPSRDESALAVSLATGKVVVTGTVLLDNLQNASVTAVLLTPDPETTLTSLALVADEDSQPDTFLFRNVPLGLRAVVIDVNGTQHTKYLQVTPGGNNLVFDLRSESTPN